LRGSDGDVQRLLRATRNTWNGLIACARGEVAFRQEIYVLVVAVPLAFFVGTDLWRRVALIAVILHIMLVELLNTTVESSPTTSRRTITRRSGASRTWARPRSGLPCCWPAWSGSRPWPNASDFSEQLRNFFTLTRASRGNGPMWELPASVATNALAKRLSRERHG
jgi:hypothetical protein